MDHIKMPELHIGNLTAKIPIIQGGMGVGVSLSGLAGAVARQGGIGVIATAGIGMQEPDLQRHFTEANNRALTREIQQAKVNANGNGLIGVNIMVALTDHESLLLTALDAGADVVFMGAGLPLKIPQVVTPERMQSSPTRIVPIVSSGRAADVICKTWGKHDCIPDAFVVEGPLAGGHLGFKKEQLDDPAYRLEILVKDTLDAVRPFEQQYGKPIAVIAGGGIYTGADIYRFLEMGAAGVQMATRFVATHECDADIRFKEQYLKARPEDIMIIDSPVGLPGRAIRNQFLNDVSAGQKKPFKCPYKCLRTCEFREAPYCIAKALINAKLGTLDDGFVFTGANSWRVNEIVSVQELMESLEQEYAAAVVVQKNVKMCAVV
ncbi:MAG TPA: nitronate monooxygenase family protein [bacterium]|nr:nitronate monooxygenase family protein [bacterium]HPN42465.1 nitronate monooxygenase family protein [bacterium]